MFLGNFLEYWLLFKLPHDGPGGWVRGLAWSAVLLGLLVTLVTSVSAGYLGFRSRQMPRWLGAVLILLFPVTLAMGFTTMHFVGIPLGIASLAVGVFNALETGASVKNLSAAER